MGLSFSKCKIQLYLQNNCQKSNKKFELKRHSCSSKLRWSNARFESLLPQQRWSHHWLYSNLNKERVTLVADYRNDCTSRDSFLEVCWHCEEFNNSLIELLNIGGEVKEEGWTTWLKGYSFIKVGSIFGDYSYHENSN